MQEKIEISIVVLTYNHMNWIAECLDSIIKQQCDTSVEILVADDCSTDGTSKIVEGYAEKYPKLLRKLERRTNLGATKNLYDAYCCCRGEYIAIVEGDDFWIDDQKLQKQYDFLEQNPEYIATTHLHFGYDSTKGYYETQWKCEPGKHTLEDFREGKIMIGHLGTMFFRNIFRTPKYDYQILESAHDTIGDITISLLLLLNGPIFCMNEYMSVQRNSGENGWGKRAKERDMEYEMLMYSNRLLSWIQSEGLLSDVGIKRMHQNLFLSLVYLKEKRSKKGLRLVGRMWKNDIAKLDAIMYLANKWRMHK